MSKKLTSLDLKWILYDVGNSAFVLLIASVLPIYFNSLAEAGGLSETEYLTWWSYAASIATVVTALAGPILGTLADFPGHKKRIFLFTALVGAGCLFCFAFPGQWMGFLVLFIIAKILYNISLVIYDSMLIDVCDEDQMDMVSSRGVCLGLSGILRSVHHFPWPDPRSGKSWLKHVDRHDDRIHAQCRLVAALYPAAGQKL